MIVMLFVALLSINFNNIVNASAKNYITNSNRVDIDIEKYQNFKKMCFAELYWLLYLFLRKYQRILILNHWLK